MPGPALTARSASRGGRVHLGRGWHDLITVFDGGPEHIGALVNVRIESISPLTLFGRIASVVSPPRTA